MGGVGSESHTEMERGAAANGQLKKRECWAIHFPWIGS